MRRLSRRRIVATSGALLGTWVLAALISMNIGSVAIPPGTAIRILKNRVLGIPSGETALEAILLSVRLPR